MTVAIPLWGLLVLVGVWGVSGAVVLVFLTEIKHRLGLLDGALVSLGPIAIVLLLAVYVAGLAHLLAVSIRHPPPPAGTLLECGEEVRVVEWADRKWWGAWEGEWRDPRYEYSESRKFDPFQYRQCKPHTPPEIAAVLNRAEVS